MTTIILRLLEDYVSASPDPSTNSQITLYKRNLLMQIAASEDDWVLVRAFVDTKTPPIWIPQSLVREAEVGFYRALKKIRLETSSSVPPGDIIEVLSVRFMSLKNKPELCWWKVRLINGRTTDMVCSPCELEPVDVPVGPPGSTYDYTKERPNDGSDEDSSLEYSSLEDSSHENNSHENSSHEDSSHEDSSHEDRFLLSI